MLGITDSGHDHDSVFWDIIPELYALGYDDYNLTVTDSISNANVLASMEQCRIYISRSHGDNGTNDRCIITGASQLWATDIYDYTLNVPMVDLTNCDLMLFVACLTASQEICLPDAAVNAGATYAIGFSESINCTFANLWTDYFFQYYADGYPVDISAQKATQACANAGSVDSYVVYE